jgi:hypothetical protein
MELQEHRIVYAAPPPGFDPTPPPPEDEGLNSDEPINSGNELLELLQSKGLTKSDPSKRTGVSAQNEWRRRRGCPCGRPCGQAPARVAGTEAGRVPQPQADRVPLCAGPTPKTENSRNELNDLLQSKGLTPNDPSKRTGSSASNEPIIGEKPPRDTAPRPDPALSRGERVARDGAVSSRRGSGEGSLHRCSHPAQHMNNSRNELHDLLQSNGLTQNYPSKRTGSLPQNEPLCGSSIGSHACAVGHRDGSRRSLRGRADRRVCGPGLFVERGI